MDERCLTCHRPLEPGGWAQLQFDGTWCCARCMKAYEKWGPTKPEARDDGR